MKILYTFFGKVKRGANRGKTLGFPTANIALHKKIPEGIYASLVKIHEKTYQAAAFIGSAKTFGEKDYKAECYILDFNRDIYEKWISVQLYKKLRNNKKFPSEKELIKQMEQDILTTRKFFNKFT